MGYFRTAILLAAMTALFMGIGYLVGGQSGMVVAFLVAAATNLFAYWRSDKMVLSMYGAREVNEGSAPSWPWRVKTHGILQDDPFLWRIAPRPSGRFFMQPIMSANYPKRTFAA